MNDELRGQLTTTYKLPAYTRLWLTTDAEATPLQGPYGKFELMAPAGELTLRWGGEDGPALAHLPWRTDSLDWDGEVRIGGFVDAMTITTLPSTPHPIVVMLVGGQPIKERANFYPGPNAAVPYSPPNFEASLATVDETTTIWLAPLDSPLVTLAENALLNKLGVWLTGQLADEGSVWAQHVGLPLLLESAATFAR